MIDSADLREGLPAIGLGESDVPAILAAADGSRARIADARAALRGDGPGLPVALGSHGRHESSRASDLDLAFLYDPAHCAREDAESDRRRCIDALRAAGFEVPEKTFRSAVAIPSLLVHVGGEEDSHESLTHRALLLTESAWLRDREASRDAWSRLFALYRDGVTRGAWLGSLLNDLQRYYRTVCLDYRHKIEEADKGWATRYVKLRHSRKTLHLSNLVAHSASRALHGDAFDSDLASRLSLPPLLKIARALGELGHGATAAPLWLRYDEFLARMADDATRAELERLRPRDEASSPAFRALKANARGLDDAAEAICGALLGDSRTRSHLLRFGLL
jgi:hypothetical protein